MNNIMILSVAVALLVGGIGGYALKGISSYKNNQDWDMMRHSYREAKEGDRNDVPGRDTGQGGMMGPSMHGDMMVRSERAFIEQMIPHHEEAIATAEEVLARGGSTPEMRSLAEAIVAAQTKEVADMKAWYQAWYSTPYTPTSSYTPMMRELENLSGAELDRAFLEDMIHHHMGAIMMARSVSPYIEHEEMRTLTGNIATTQSEEITRMRDLLTKI